MDEGITQFLAANGCAEARITALAGDASTRRYYRATPGSNDRSYVVMADAPFPPSSPDGEPFAFERWRSFLAALDIRVPSLHGMDREAGLALLEDLGDELLQHRVEEQGAEACKAHYRLAVAWGRRLAEVGTVRFDPDREPWDDPLDARRLGVEMDFFLQHGLGLAMPPDASATGPVSAARELLHQLCEEVHSAGPGEAGMVLCHRDYHARNLLVLPEQADGSPRLAMIDFQDIRRGPRAYDLASLIHDPYVSLPAVLRDELTEAWRPDDVDREQWSKEVRLAAGQRLIKAAGSYAYLGHALGRGEYLQWFEPALTRAFEQLSSWELGTSLERAIKGTGITWG